MMKRQHSYSASTCLVVIVNVTALAVAQDNAEQDPGSIEPPNRVFRCPTEPADGVPEGPGGGMAGNGWDGAGQNATTVFWHVEGTTPDFGAGQRTAMINALQAWASVVQITFQEVAVADADRSIDLNFLTRDHCAAEAQECGNANCPFDGALGVLAHAGFPPGVNATCPGVLSETMAGNVHFDEDDAWEQDNAGGPNAFSLTLIACHEIGHGLGLTHSGGTDVMRPTFNANDAFAGLSTNDVTQIRTGYASGAGSVIPLTTTGIWVDGGFPGTQLGLPANPVTTVMQGVNGVPPFATGVVVHVHVRHYNERMTIDRNMTLRAEGVGVAVIGRSNP